MAKQIPIPGPVPMRQQTPCRWCRHCSTYDPEEKLADCVREPGFRHRALRPYMGCDHWEREPGADDDLEPAA